MEAGKYPLLLALHQKRGSEIYFRVWCPFCRKWHFHSEEEGYRIAHCNEGSPFRKSGYILKDARKDRFLKDKLK